MRLLKFILVFAIILLGAAAAGSALARSGHGGGHSGGHASAGHSGGSHVGVGSHVGASHFGGSHVGVVGHVGAGHVSAGHAGGIHSGARIGVVVGAPLIAPWYYYPTPAYYYDYPPAYALPAPAPVYYEQSSGPTAPAQQPSYWYFCASSKSYYPYVQECPEGWQPVVPQAPSPS